MNPVNYLYLSALLFTIGAAGVLIRRNAIVVFMCVELMLNACNLAFVPSPGCTATSTARSSRSSRWSSPPPRSWSGSRSSCRLFRSRHSASVDDANLMKL